jgi:hypothetical protein
MCASYGRHVIIRVGGAHFTARALSGVIHVFRSIVFFLRLRLVAPMVVGGSSPVGGKGLRDSPHCVPTARISPVSVRVVHYCCSLRLVQCV